MPALPRILRDATLAAGLSLAVLVPLRAQAAEPDAASIEKLVPELEKQVAAGMRAFSVPGVAIGIVHDDRLIYAKGFGVRRAGETAPVTADTIFQVGSTTKAFFATTLAQAADAGKLKWSDPVAERLPEFQLADPWVSRDFRVLDLAAQRSGLTPYVNDGLTFLGFDKATLIRSLRTAPQTGIFRSDFRYLNIPHLAGGEIVAAVNGERSWFDSLKRTLLDPLGMAATSATPEAIEAVADHATGHRLDDKPVPIPFHAAFPYAMGPAGALNSNVPDMAKWLRLQLGRGQFGGKVIVSEANLDVTWTPRAPLGERLSYAVGWCVLATPHGRVIWHNGGTNGFGAHVGFLPDAKTGIVILTNIDAPGLADSLAQWFYDRVLDNPLVDNVAIGAAADRKQREQARQESATLATGPLPADAQALEGSYASPLLGTATVSLNGARLQAVLERTEVRLLLDAGRDDPSLFAVRIAAEGSYAPIVAITGDSPVATIRFERDPVGRVTGFRFLDATLPHGFTRQEAE
ncbi:serine hydrolase domain-containing protein [Bosea thiooxidans]